MRRALVTAPLALLSGACALRPWTPSTTVAYWAEATPPTRPMVVPAQPDAVARWQLPPTNPWARYSKYTLLTAADQVPREVDLPDIERLDVVQDARAAAARIAEVGLPADTMWLVDLRGAASVAFGAELTKRAREPASLVLTFNNWPAENELIPAEETLAALLSMAPRLAPPEEPAPRPVFLLDAWRLAYRFDTPDDDVVDNRYIVTDLPDPATLQAARIQRVVYVVEDLDETEVPEDDMHAFLLQYQLAGVSLSLVDLRWLAREPRAARWDALLASRLLFVEPRRTLIDDPQFYVRAHGGFGGIHGGPSPFRPGGWWYGRGVRGGGGGGGFGG